MLDAESYETIKRVWYPPILMIGYGMDRLMLLIGLGVFTQGRYGPDRQQNY